MPRSKPSAGDVLSRFSPATRAWFEGAFDAPTPAQAGAWDAVAAGEDALVVAPTGSGKTLAAFLWSLDRLATTPAVDEVQRLRVLYVSPLKALAVDVERNLRVPLAGMTAAAERLGLAAPDVQVAVRTGDTPADERRRFARKPPDILITTPESLYLILTSAAREALRGVETVIVDEVHAVAGTKRGAHLALTLERLDALLPRRAQRIGLSATVRPPEEVARFLGGERQVRVVAPPSEKEFDLQIVVPVEDMTAPGGIDSDALDIGVYEGSAAGAEARESVWPHVEARLLDVIKSHRSTLVFVNSRRLAERLCTRLNDLAGEEIARAHHGSVAREQRTTIEEALKEGRLPAVVATSSLELGIDMGAVDLVVHVGAPDSVSSGLQRIGRAGHQVGAVSHGLVFPRFRSDLLESVVVVDRIRNGEIEELSYPRNPLDVLAQQIVAMVAMEDLAVDDVETIVRRAAPFAELPRSALESVLDMLSGRYPSDEFAELRPRLNWDRATGILSRREGAQRLAVTSGGTIPDRGLFAVFIAGENGSRVGELDEEMVYESRPGDIFVLGSSSWLIEEITHDRVLVSPAPGQAGKMPFWHGDAPGRPLELGKAIGAYTRKLAQMSPEARLEHLRAAGLDDYAAQNLVALLDEQKEATGILPDDRTILVERFQDELGDWRVCIHSFFGARVHAPWAQAIEARLRDEAGVDVQCVYSDDGIVVRLPEAHEAPAGTAVLVEAAEVEDLVTREVGTSALFASRFRECAARALLLPKRRPGQRTPLWQQRQKSAGLLQVAARFGSFPVILETFRECLQDVFDLPALKELMDAVQRREVRIVEVETPYPSPFASSLQFGYISAFMYEGDAPLAERRAQALSLDRALLAELMGQAELRELLDPGALGELELELQHLNTERKARHADDLHDMLRSIGDLTEAEAMARSLEPAVTGGWLEGLEAERRALRMRVAGRNAWIAIEDAARFRDALGASPPPGTPTAFLEPMADPVGDLVARFARTHGPFVPADVATRLGLGEAVVVQTLERLERVGRVHRGGYRPGGAGIEWIDKEVLQRLRRRSLAALRREIEPAEPAALVRFLSAWQGVGTARRDADADAVLRAIEQLQGVPIPASALETQVLPARLQGYQPGLLDQLGAAGEVVWCGVGAIGSDDGYISIALAEAAPLLLPAPQAQTLSETAEQIVAALAGGGGLFFRQIAGALDRADIDRAAIEDEDLLAALWECVWSGHVTNDTLVPLRALGGGTRRGRGRARPRRAQVVGMRAAPPAGAGRWSLVGERDPSDTRRAAALADQLLSRHGIVTRGVANIERIPGGFAAVYQVLKAMEETGRCRRGYFVEGLGGAQFALPGAVDRMRALADDRAAEISTQVLAATDPANPFGAALPWPEREGGHRPGRKPGAVVVLVDGQLAIYVERGGRTLLSFTDDEDVLQPAVDALALAARDGALGRLSVEKADGEAIEDTAFARALMAAGFRRSTKGLRLRA